MEKLIREDIMYDSSVFIENNDFSFYGYVLNINNLDKTPDLGDMPKADNEVVLSGYDDGWTFGEKPEDLIGKTFTVSTDGGTNHKVKVAGIVLLESGDDEDIMYTENSMIYFSDPLIAEIRKGMYASNSTTTMLLNGTEQTLYPGAGGLVINDNVPEGYSFRGGVEQLLLQLRS